MLSIGKSTKLLEEVLVRVLPAMIAVAGDPVIVINNKGDIVFANHHTYRVFGYDAGELEGQSLESLIPNSARIAHVEHFRDFMRNPMTRTTRMMTGGQIQALKNNGTVIPVEVGLTPIGPNNQPGKLVMAYIREIVPCSV